MGLWVDVNGWPAPPEVLLVCLVAEILYFRGWEIIVRGTRAKEAAARARKPSTFAGSAAGKSPWTEIWARLFWVHMIQHLLLLLVIAPLLVVGAPAIPLWLGLPRWARRAFKRCVRLKVRRGLYRAAGWLRRPVVSCALLLIGVWAWHWPPLYDLALTNGIIHDWCEHATFLAVSVLFWTQVISSPPLHIRMGYLGRLGCVGFAILQNLILAILIGFSQAPLYTPYVHLAASSLSALQDQHLGAGIMWTFGDLPFGIAFAAVLHRWLVSVTDEPAATSVGEKQSA
jgi:putative membrane protein